MFPTESRMISEHDLFLRGPAGPPRLARQGGAGLVQVGQVTGGLQSGQCKGVVLFAAKCVPCINRFGSTVNCVQQS